MSKRIKHVFPTAMISHVWAQQSQDEGWNSCKNHSFRGTALYSYATPIANFVTNKKGQKAVLITTKSYSVTTSSSHMPSARDIPPGIPVFHVYHIGITGGRSPYPTEDLRDAPYKAKGKDDYHVANVNHMAKVYKHNAEDFSRSKDFRDNPAPFFSDNKAKAYCDFFGLRFPEKLFAPYSVEQLKELQQKFRKEAAEKGKETKKRRIEREAKAEKELQEYIAGTRESLDYDWKRNSSDEQKARRDKFEIEQFIAGKSDRLPNDWNHIVNDTERYAICEKILDNFSQDEKENLHYYDTAGFTDKQHDRYNTIRAGKELRWKQEAEKGISDYLSGLSDRLPRNYSRYATEQQERDIRLKQLDNWREG